MNATSHLIWSQRWLFLFVSLCLCSAILQADQQLDDQFPPPDGTADQKMLQRYEKQLQEIQDELGELNLPVPAELTLQDDNIACLLDSPYLAQFRSGRSQHRFLAGRLVIVNLSDKSLMVETQSIRLLINGKEYRVGEKQGLNKYVSFRKGNRHYSLPELKVSEKIEVPAGQVASSWVVFNGLIAGNDVPSITLSWEINKRPFTLDASLQHRALLRWRREQIGPRGVIALCTIHGEVNTINMGTAINDLILLATQNITRVVISFGEQAPAVDSHLMKWFQQIASLAGRETRQNNYSEFPVVPAMIRQIHLANFPHRKMNFANPQGVALFHKNLNDAVIAISQSVYESIPVSELVQEIRSGSPLTKPAALIHGAPRLPNDFLPEVIAMSVQDTEQLLKTAALITLGNFNDPRAVTALWEAAQSKETAVAQVALISLGASRFPVHQNALRSLLKSPPELQQRVVRVLAQFPRKRWAETLYQHAQTGPVSLRVEALKALDVIGHPQLQKMLICLLQDNEETLQKTALKILSQRDDRLSRKTVINYALQQLENGDADPQTFQALTRYKVHRAVPGLLTLLKTDKQQRSLIINTLAVIGSEQILDAFVEIYPELTQSQERISILQTLRRIDQGRFLEFAPSALKTEDVHVVSSISSLLREIAREEAVDVLIEAISQREDKDHQLSSLISALGGISTPRSRRYLVELRDSQSERKSQAARSALRNIYSRSPVNYLNSQANTTSRSGNYALAIKQFTLAIDGDSYYPFAHEGRALAYRALGENEKALADYRQLLKLDPRWPKVHGRMGQTLTAMTRFEEAIESLRLAIQQEPESANWYSSRGHAYSMTEDFKKAEVDYRKSLELDPKNMTAITGIALSMAINGKIDEAITQIQTAHAEYENNAVFAYNVACTYSRAAEYLQKKLANDPQHKQRIDQLIEKGLDELARSISLGYQDKNWTVADPDLTILKEHQRFDKLLLKMGSKKQDKKTDPPTKKNPATEKKS